MLQMVPYFQRVLFFHNHVYNILVLQRTLFFLYNYVYETIPLGHWGYHIIDSQIVHLGVLFWYLSGIWKRANALIMGNMGSLS